MCIAAATGNTWAAAAAAAATTAEAAGSSQQQEQDATHPLNAFIWTSPPWPLTSHHTPRPFSHLLDRHILPYVAVSVLLFSTMFAALIVLPIVLPQAPYYMREGAAWAARGGMPGKVRRPDFNSR